MGCHIIRCNDVFPSQVYFPLILIQIEEVKSYFQDNEDQELDVTPNEIRTDPSLVFPGQDSSTKYEILQALPERNTIDRLVSRFFNSTSASLCEYSK